MEIPIELFILGIAVPIALALFGFLRNPQVPAMLTFGGIFILFISISTTEIVLGQNINATNIQSTEQAITTVIPSALSRWEFESNAFDSNDGNPLNEQNSPTYSDLNNIPELGEYIILNGSTQFLNATNASQLDVTTQDFSILGVIKRTSDSGTEEHIFNKLQLSPVVTGYRILNVGDDRFTAQIWENNNNGGTSSTNTIELDVWYVFAIIFDRDGDVTLHNYNLSTDILVTNTGVSGTTSGNISNNIITTVGTSATSPTTLSFGGQIAELRFYNGIKLTQAQFMAIINNDFTDSDIVDGISTISNENNTFEDNTFEFTELPKTIFALLGAIFMLSGALMVFRSDK